MNKLRRNETFFTCLFRAFICFLFSFFLSYLSQKTHHDHIQIAMNLIAGVNNRETAIGQCKP